MKGEKKKKYKDYRWDKKTSIEDWVDDILKTAKMLFPKVKQEDFEDLTGQVILNLAKIKFPSCVKNYPNCSERAPYNYMYTAVQRCYYNYIKKQNKTFTGHLEEIEEIYVQFDEGDVESFQIVLEALSVRQQEMVREAYNNPKHWKKNYAPWEINQLARAIGYDFHITQSMLDAERESDRLSGL